MERGTSKEVTGKEHLERTDFIIAKQKQEAEQAKAARQAAIAAKEEAEAELLFVEGENKAKEQYRLSLDSEIAEREAYWIASAALSGSASPQRSKRKTPS